MERYYRYALEAWVADATDATDATGAALEADSRPEGGRRQGAGEEGGEEAIAIGIKAYVLCKQEWACESSSRMLRDVGLGPVELVRRGG